MTELVAFLREKGFNLDPVLDGSFKRFDRAGELSGWFTGRAYNLNGKEVLVARFGDWKTDERHEWKSEGPFTLPERQEIDRLMTEVIAAEKEAKLKLQEEVSERCRKRWGSLVDRGSSPYLQRKLPGLQPKLYGCKLMATADDVLTAVPARDIDGKLWGIQYIGGEGKKNFTSGMRIRGCFHQIGEIEPEDTIYVCEGLATGASIYAATGGPVACAFNAGNLEAVASALAGRYGSDCQIVVAGDDDRGTRRPDGSAWNPGREKALAAARAVGGMVCFPRFGAGESRGTDFNDLHVSDGLEAVSQQLSEAKAPGEEDEPRASGAPARVEAPQREGLQPLPWRTHPKTGKQVAPTDKQVADALLEFYEGRMVKQEEDLFRYTGTHWKMLKTHDRHELYNEIQYLYSGRAGAAKIEAIFKLFLFQVEAAPVDMLTARSTQANFLNGTLHAVRGPDYKYRLEFRPHNARDYVTSVIPLEYDPERRAKNEEFEGMLGRVFQGDADGADKIRAIRQMYGACLMPLYPHLFLLHGPAGSGKSSLILPAARLVHQENWCSVAPHEFTGFLMESMIGKLVNIVTDIKTNQAISDDHLKKIEDRVPVRIDRKYERPIQAPFPATHIFGANEIPPTLDGASGAHTRRWTFIEVSKYRAEGTSFRKDYANWMFEQSPQGVLNFALAGLEDVMAQEGHFTNPESGKKRLAAWQLENDPVGLFFEAVRSGEVDTNTQINFGEHCVIPRSRLWENFTGWVKNFEMRYVKLGRNKFFGLVEAKGYRVKVIEGVYHFTGIGVETDPRARF